jgi:hypothetical protein
MDTTDGAGNEPEAAEAAKKPSKFRPRLHFNWRNLDPRNFKSFSKKHQIIYGLVVLFILILAVPFTRYPVLGQVIKKDLSVRIIDNQKGLPVTEAEVEVQGKRQKTDKEGIAKIGGIKVGPAKVTVSKKYYQTTTFDAFAGLLTSKINEAKIQPTGQLIKAKVVNKINRQAVSNAVIKINGESFRTDESGVTLVVIALDVKEAEAEVSAEGFTNSKTKIVSSDSEEPADENTLGIVPQGKIYFLSKLSGKIDVVKTNLDGTERQTVLAGTGNENEFGTVLLASRDWKYLALLAVREKGKPAKLHLIDTSQNDKLSVIDEGNADFQVDGWLNHHLIFRVTRNDVKDYENERFRLKSFNAETNKLVVLDRSKAHSEGPGYSSNYYYPVYYDNRYWYEAYGGVTITDEVVIFGKNVYYYGLSDGEDGTDGAKVGLYTINPDNSDRKIVVEQDRNQGYMGEYINYKPKEVYYSLGNKYYEYEYGSSPKEISREEFSEGQIYINFVISPDGKETFWAELRDGKNVLFTGNLHLEDPKQIASLSELKPYGWYTHDYLLLSKNGSELYIMSRSGGEPVKVSDYHKPNIDYNGYGYGYGGN